MPSPSVSNGEKPTPVLSSAPPPLHSLIVWGIVTAIWVYNLPSLETIDQDATVETFTRRIFPDLITVPQLAYIRLGIAAIIWMTTIDIMLSEGTEIHTTYLPQSKLKPAVIQLKGFRTLLPFTSIAWTLLGLSFTLSGYITLNATTRPISPLILRLALILWEISAPLAALVSIVVRYIIWPMVLQPSGDSSSLRTIRILLQHNFNILATLTEIALLGGLVIRWNHVSFTGLFGNAYSVLTWSMTTCWGNNVKESGPQFIYFFTDTTIPGFFPTAVGLGLIAVTLSFSAMFAYAETLLKAMPGGLLAHVLFVLTISSGVMRFRD